ncbi:unnamed protein product [Hydatigera taeniaeformis]|uniref:CCDC66 domain-containing protein n=1 Tax=Hydatigena taeniaeformis TaxID=6205 RepID=A0A0R3WSG8_HYDTA|nr:unnamed protein product [Hydatigera taeniaeformis]
MSFFNFQNKDIERIRKRQELSLEYQQFKLLDEEKFRNRFASKKTNKTEQVNKGVVDSTSTISSENSGDHIKILLNRLEVLQKDVDELKQSQSNLETRGNNNTNTETEDDHKVKVEEPRNLNIIDEAVKHLNELESIIMTLTVSENHKTSNLDRRPLSSLARPEGSDGNKQCSLSSPGSSTSQKRIKPIKKEEYANGLNKQIREMQEQKALERIKGREEDRVKLAEMHKPNKLDYRTRVKGEETVNQNPALLNTMHSRYARGGNGIFGDPLTETQKQANAMYRAELMNQIEEKRQREAKRIQAEKELDRKEEEFMNAATSSSLKGHDQLVGTKICPVLSQETSNKHNVCVQVVLENKHPQPKPKAAKVVRTPVPVEKIKDSSKLADLLAQVTQLKVELAAEEVRIQQSRSESEDIVQVYDPRLLNVGPSRIGRSASPSFSRPIKVHRVIETPVYKIKVARSAQDCEEPGYLSCSSTFVLHNEKDNQRSPSLDSLNLDTINRRMERRFEQLGIREDLYEKEEPIIRKFMAEERARCMTNFECY